MSFMYIIPQVAGSVPLRELLDAQLQAGKQVSRLLKYGGASWCADRVVYKRRQALQVALLYQQQHNCVDGVEWRTQDRPFADKNSASPQLKSKCHAKASAVYASNCRRAHLHAPCQQATYKLLSLAMSAYCAGSEPCR